MLKHLYTSINMQTLYGLLLFLNNYIMLSNFVTPSFIYLIIKNRHFNVVKYGYVSDFQTWTKHNLKKNVSQRNTITGFPQRYLLKWLSALSFPPLPKILNVLSIPQRSCRVPSAVYLLCCNLKILMSDLAPQVTQRYVSCITTEALMLDSRRKLKVRHA